MDALLNEDGTYLLQEDGTSKILLEQQPGVVPTPEPTPPAAIDECPDVTWEEETALSDVTWEEDC